MKKITVTLILSCLGCTAALRYPPVRWLEDQDRQPIAKPADREQIKYVDIVDKQLFYQLERLSNLPERGRALSYYAGLGSKREALNVNNFDEVADNSWFTNRIGRRRMSVREIAEGPGPGHGPDLEGPWIILAAKTEGLTPGFVVEDKRGDRFLIKFDPAGHTELAGAAESISTKFLHAIGFNVPENSIVTFDPAILKVSPRATTKDRYGRKRPFTQDDMKDLFARVAHVREGVCRALASRFLPGEPLGPFPFRGRRRDDANDRIPHEHRRELRGYRVFSAFLNNSDSREANSLDMFVKDPETGNGSTSLTTGGHVKHYLIDFGGTLGSAGVRPKSSPHMYDYGFNYGRVMGSLVFFGLYTPYWERAEAPDFPSVGMFESKLFRPEKWKPSYPNPSFQNMTDRDGFWAAKILMQFSDEAIRAIVGKASYSDLKARDYVVKTLVERRDKIGRYWYRRLNPLDHFDLEKGQEIIRFEDLAVTAGFEKQGMTDYRYRLHRSEGKQRIDGWQETKEPKVSLTRWEPLSDGKVYTLQLQTRRDKTRPWSSSVDLMIKKEGGWQILSLRRR